MDVKQLELAGVVTAVAGTIAGWLLGSGRRQERLRTVREDLDELREDVLRDYLRKDVFEARLSTVEGKLDGLISRLDAGERNREAAREEQRKRHEELMKAICRGCKSG